MYSDWEQLLIRASIEGGWENLYNKIVYRDAYFTYMCRGASNDVRSSLKHVVINPAIGKALGVF